MAATPVQAGSNAVTEALLATARRVEREVDDMLSTFQFTAQGMKTKVSANGLVGEPDSSKTPWNPDQIETMAQQVTNLLLNPNDPTVEPGLKGLADKIRGWDKPSRQDALERFTELTDKLKADYKAPAPQKVSRWGGDAQGFSINRKV